MSNMHMREKNDSHTNLPKQTYIYIYIYIYVYIYMYVEKQWKIDP